MLEAAAEAALSQRVGVGRSCRPSSARSSGFPERNEARSPARASIDPAYPPRVDCGGRALRFASWKRERLPTRS
jgi:hypothetical protein